MLDNQFNFDVKGENDAYILLSNKYNWDGYLIAIGSHANAKSFLRDGKQGTDEQLVDTPNILSAKEWKRFWISYTFQANSLTIA